MDVLVDLRQSIFVATANDWSKVAPVVRDRFIVIDVDGYSRSEKSQIVSDYIIPKLEKCYAASGVSIAIDDEAEDFLLRTYATWWKNKADLDMELADIAIYLMGIAELMGIDLELAIRTKMVTNEKRTYKIIPGGGVEKDAP